jgi:hypothetical protein
MGKIRLACMNCDRNDFDGITEQQLAEAIEHGWQDVTEEQSYENSIKERPSGDDRMLDWWTHLGWCPDCGEPP